MRDRQPCVYMLASKFNGTLYVGVTSDLLARVTQHRQGATPGFTTRHKVHRLVWFETCERMEDAIAHEKRIKKWPRDRKKNPIERDNPEWHDLTVTLGFEPPRQMRGGPRNKSGVTADDA